MSKTVSNILYNGLQLAVTPLSSRQKAKTLSRVAERLVAKGDATVPTKHGSLQFYSGRGSAVASAVNRFFEDEPETLHYIDTVIGDNEVLFDIGANAGLYSLYAARRGAVVYAFEPSAFNFSLLVDHVRLNALSGKIKPLCIAFSDSDGVAELQMAEVTAGHASNSIGEARNQHGAFTPAFTQAVLTFRLDSFCRQFGAVPQHIKLDVDGLEPLILSGGPDTLAGIKSLLVEIEGENAGADSQMLAMIQQAGLAEDTAFRDLGASGRNRLFVRPAA